MNGAHDLGGLMGFGAINPPRTEPVFHAEWERRVFALMMAVGDVGGWSIDEDRAACENMEPARYLSTSYYEHWLHGLEELLKRHTPKPAPTRPQDVWPLVTASGTYRRETGAKPRFAVGAAVRVLRLNPEGHTRAPRYLRGVAGEIVSLHGAHVFPDSNAAGTGEDPRNLYTVRFRAEDVFGGRRDDVIHADLWEPYLEPA